MCTCETCVYSKMCYRLHNHENFNDCEDYEFKSPYKIGDIIYARSYNKVVPLCISDITISKKLDTTQAYIKCKCLHYYECFVDEPCPQTVYLCSADFPIKDRGYSFFDTMSEAEEFIKSNK